MKNKIKNSPLSSEKPRICQKIKLHKSITFGLKKKDSDLNYSKYQVNVINPYPIQNICLLFSHYIYSIKYTKCVRIFILNFRSWAYNVHIIWPTSFERSIIIITTKAKQLSYCNTIPSIYSRRWSLAVRHFNYQIQIAKVYLRYLNNKIDHSLAIIAICFKIPYTGLHHCRVFMS